MGDNVPLMPGVVLLEEGDGLGRSVGSRRWKAALEILESAPHNEQLLMLTEVSSFLSYANEESMIGFPAWSYVRVLMHIVRYPDVKYSTVKSQALQECPSLDDSNDTIQGPFYELLNVIYKNQMRSGVLDIPVDSTSVPGDAPEPKEAAEAEDTEDESLSDELSANKALMAAGCLNSILDILPHASSFFLSNIKQLYILKEKLCDIQCVELAERILLIYEKLIKEIPISVVKSGSLVAMLECVNFFPPDVQISTYMSVMNSAKKIERSESCQKYLVPLVPYLAEALKHNNNKIVQMACVTWKLIMGKVVRSTLKKGFHDSTMMGSMVTHMLNSDALKDMCRLVFSENDKIRRINVNQCLYCMAVVTNESNELVSRLFEYDVLDHIARWLTTSGEDTILRLVNIGLAIMGSYFFTGPLSSDCTQLHQRAEYFREHRDRLLHVIATFPMATLTEIFGSAISENLRNRIMLLQLRILEMAIDMEECRSQIMDGLPYKQLVDAVCYSLRYQHHEDQCGVAIHLSMCLLRLMDQEVIVDILRRHGMSSLLSLVQNPKLEKEIDFILQRVPPLEIQRTPKSGIDLIVELKAQGKTTTLYELANSGILELDFEDFLSTQSLTYLLHSLVFRDFSYPELTAQTMDCEGLLTLWNTFTAILETQPEFTFHKKEEADSDDDEGNDDQQPEAPIDVATSHIPEIQEAEVFSISPDCPGSDIVCESKLPDPADEAMAPGTANMGGNDNDNIEHEETATDSHATGNTGKREIKSGRPRRRKQNKWIYRHRPFARSSSRSSMSSGAGSRSRSHSRGRARSRAATQASPPDAAEESISDKEETVPSVEAPLDLCEEVVTPAPSSALEGTTTEQGDRMPRSKRPEGRSNKPHHPSSRQRSRLKTAMSFINQVSDTDALPFPFSHLEREIKLKLKCINDEEEFSTIPLLSLYTSPLVSAAKVESYVLAYLNSEVRKNDGNQPLTPKRRAKVIPNMKPDGEGPYAGVQLYYKKIPLVPTTQLYKVLSETRRHEDLNIWQECAMFHFSVISQNNTFEFQRLYSGRYTTLMASICDDRHSAVGLYMAFANYVNGNDRLSVEVTLTKLRERLNAMDCSESPSEIQQVLEKVHTDTAEYGDLTPSPPKSRSAIEDPSSLCPMESMETEGVTKGSMVVLTRESFKMLHVDYLAGRVTRTLERMDKILEGSTPNDALVTVSMPSRSDGKLEAASCKYVLMLVILHVLITELRIFFGSTELTISYSKRLTLKLLTHMAQLDESLCYRIPKWFKELVLICPSLFSLDSRRILFDYLAVGPHRLFTQFHARISALADAEGGTDRESEGNAVDSFDEILRRLVVSRRTIKSIALQDVEAAMHVPKLKCICSRREIVKDAILVMNQVVKSAGELEATPRLEIEFECEVGVGSGPTQEFYSLVIERIMEGDHDDLVFLEDIGGYLYPKLHPNVASAAQEINVDMLTRLPKTAGNRLLEHRETQSARIFRIFKLLGQMCATSLMDRKLLSLRMHPLFWYQCQQPTIERNCSLAALSAVDPVLAQSLGNLRNTENLEEVDLYFSYGGVSLVPNGLAFKVTRDNVDDYINRVVTLRLYDGIRLQVWAFRLGFATLLPLEALSLFTAVELADEIFNSNDQPEFWTSEHLQTYILPDHGYDFASVAYREFISVLASFSQEERRQFLRFCTGAPVLPKDGFAGLRPLMRVVKKGEDTDELPSVMTCSNYLKLPDYKSEAQLRTKLLQAVYDGQGSFNLS